jgi:hypothetical protein
MQKRISLILSFLLSGVISAQNFVEGFQDVPALFSAGWVQQNNSSPLGSGGWGQDIGNFNPPPSSPNNSAIICDYSSIQSGQSGDISNWLITPTISFTPGDSIIFFTRSFNNAAYPDRMEVRLNRNNTTDVGSTTTSVGDFDTTFLVINPTLSTSSSPYPMVWTRYAFMITGISPSTPCRIGFRYFVTDGGQSGSNGSTIGIDNFEYRSVFTGLENQSPLKAFVQLVNGQLTIEVPEAQHAFSVELLDVSGRSLVKSDYEKKSLIDLNIYNNGVYLLRITYEGKYLIKKISF